MPLLQLCLPHEKILQLCFPHEKLHAFVELIPVNLTPATYGTTDYYFYPIVSSGWEDIRTVHGIIYDTPNDAARQRGLVQDHEEYPIAFEEAIEFSTPRELRTLLVTFIIAGAPASALGGSHCSALDADFRSTTSPSTAQQRATRDIDLVLKKHGQSTPSVELPAVEHDNSKHDGLLSAFDGEATRHRADNLILKLKADQRLFFYAVSTSTESQKRRCFHDRCSRRFR